MSYYVDHEAHMLCDPVGNGQDVSMSLLDSADVQLCRSVKVKNVPEWFQAVPSKRNYHQCVEENIQEPCNYNKVICSPAL